MKEDNWGLMKEEEFDAALCENVPETPPDDVAKGVTPWRRAVWCALIGMTMNLLTFHYWNLDYILPGIGLVFCLVGFRALRKENGWFRACFFMAVFRSAYYIFVIVLNTSIYQENIQGMFFMRTAYTINYFMHFLLCVCLWMGFKAVRKKSGQSVKMGITAALPLWYFCLLVLAWINYRGVVVLVLMLLAYMLIFVSFLRLTKRLDVAGYAIRPVAVCVPGTVIALGFVFLLAGGILCNWFFFNRYPMKWENVQDNEAVGAEEEENIKKIKEDLLAQGFPEDVLYDLTKEEIQECEGALQVHSTTGLLLVEGVKREYLYEGVPGEKRYYYTYENEELRVTQIAVELPGEERRWKIIHHFHWVVDPGFYGTESIQLWPTWNHTRGWEKEGEITGRVLYEKNGEVYAAPYYSLGEVCYDRDSSMIGGMYSTDVFALFSVPKNAHDCRAYVAYTTAGPQGEGYISSWVFYTHQKSYFQCPAVTAIRWRITRGLNEKGAFKTVHTALKIRTEERED